MHCRTLIAGIAFFAAVLSPLSHADYRTDYEDLNTGPLTGQDGYALPGGLPVSAAFEVQGYSVVPMNAVNPGGLDRLVIGEHPGGGSIAASERNLDFQFGGRWRLAFDLLVVQPSSGTPDAVRIGSVGTRPASAKGFEVEVRWVDPATPTEFRLAWKVVDAAGTAIDVVPPGPDWQNLVAERWYRVTTTVDFDRNRVDEVSFLRLDNGARGSHAPSQWNLGAVAASLPDSILLRVDGGSQAGVRMAFDNLRVRNANVLERRGGLTVYDRGRHQTWLIDANAPRNGGVIGIDPGGNPIPTPPRGLLTRAEAEGFANYINSTGLPGNNWRLPGTPDSACREDNELSDLYRAMGNIVSASSSNRVFNASVDVSENGYEPVAVDDQEWVSPRTFRKDLAFSVLRNLLDDPKVVEIDVHEEPFLDNRYPFADLSSNAPYWLGEDGLLNPAMGRSVWWFNGESMDTDETLRRYVMLVHDGDLNQSGGEPIPPDADNDMIADDVDDDPMIFSDQFSSGANSGVITSRGGQRLSLTTGMLGSQPVIRVRSGAFAIGNELSTFPSGLQRRGPGLVYDADRDVTWQRSASLVDELGYNNAANTVHSEGRLTFEEAAGCGEGPCVPPPASLPGSDDFMDMLSQSAIGCGGTDWRLPGTNGFCGAGLGCDGGEVGYLYSVQLDRLWGRIPGVGPGNSEPFRNVKDDFYWIAEDFVAPGSSQRFAFSFGSGMQETFDKSDGRFVWPVHDGDVGGPQPATIEACGGTMAISVYRWQIANLFCASGHVQSERGRIKAIFKLSDGSFAQTRLPAGHQIGFDQQTGAFSAPDANQATLAIQMSGETLELGPGETIRVDEQPQPTSWQILIAIIVAAILAAL